MDPAAGPQTTPKWGGSAEEICLSLFPALGLSLVPSIVQTQEEVNHQGKRGDGGHGGQTLCREESRERKMICGGVGVGERPREQSS